MDNKITELRESTSIKVTKVQHLPKFPVIVVAHSIIPLFYLKIDKDGNSLAKLINPLYKFRLMTPDEQITIFISSYEQQVLNERGMESLDFLIEDIMNEPIASDYFKKNNLSPSFIHFRGYVSKKELLKDYASLLEYIPQL